MEDLFGVASSCDKFRVSLPGADAFSAFKSDYGCHYSIERPFKVFARIRHGQCSSATYRHRQERSKAEKQSQRFANISDPYARALARPFNGIGQTNISRKYTHIKRRITDLYECARLFPAPSTAKLIALRTAQRVKAYAIPADETCRYCGGLMLQTWVDERWRRLLDHVTGEGLPSLV